MDDNRKSKQYSTRSLFMLTAVVAAVFALAARFGPRVLLTLVFLPFLFAERLARIENLHRHFWRTLAAIFLILVMFPPGTSIRITQPALFTILIAAVLWFLGSSIYYGHWSTKVLAIPALAYQLFVITVAIT